VIDVIPSYTLNAMIATKRLEQEIEMKFNSDVSFEICIISSCHGF